MLRRLALLVILLAFFGCVSQNPPAPNQSYAQNVSNETINQTYNGTTENISIVNSTSIENDSSQNASIVNVSVANGSAGNSSISSIPMLRSSLRSAGTASGKAASNAMVRMIPRASPSNTAGAASA